MELARKMMALTWIDQKMQDILLSGNIMIQWCHGGCPIFRQNPIFRCSHFVLGEDPKLDQGQSLEEDIVFCGKKS